MNVRRILASVVSVALAPPLLGGLTQPASAMTMDDGRDDLYLVGRDVGGMVGVNGVSAATGFQGYTMAAYTALPASLSDSDRWTYKFADFDGDRITDMFAIDEDHGGHTHVTVLDGSDDFASELLDVDMPLGPTTAWNYQFDVGDFNNDGFADIYEVNKDNPGGHTAIYVWDAASLFQGLLWAVDTPLGVATDPLWQFDVADYNGDRKADLFATYLDAAGHTAVNVLDAASGFHSWSVLWAQTPLGAIHDPLWDLDYGDYNGDGRADLYGIYRNAGGRTAVNVVDGASGFQTYSAMWIQTVIGRTDAPVWDLEVSTQRSTTGAPSGGQLPDDVLFRGDDPEGDITLVGDLPVSGTYDIDYKKYSDLNCYVVYQNQCRMGYHVAKGTAKLKLRTYKVDDGLVNYDHYLVDARVSNRNASGMSHQGWLKVSIDTVGPTTVTDHGDTESESEVEDNCGPVELGFSAGIVGVSLSPGNVRLCGRGASWDVDSHSGSKTTWRAHDLRNIKLGRSGRWVKVPAGSHPTFEVTVVVPTDHCTHVDHDYDVCTDFDPDTSIVRSYVIATTGY